MKNLISICLILLFGLGNISGQNYLKISDNDRFLVKSDGQPFFWLGDTAWELIHRLNEDETRRYLDDREQKGFTIIQTVILAELDGLRKPNAKGDLPLFELDPTKPNEKYFKHVDFVLKQAEKRNLYVGLLPTWGDKWSQKWGVGPEIFTPANAKAYGKYLGERYKNQKNIIWILGGDRTPENENHKEIIRAMAKGIKSADKNHLLTYHISSAKIASNYFNEDWLDIDMLQTQHRKVSEAYNYVWKAKESKPVRPVINGEPRYENIPVNFSKPEEGWVNDADVRKSAYWSYLAGAAGFTYGCNDIWQMYSTDNQPILFARTGWEAALQLPGAHHMRYVKKLFTAFPWQQLQNNQSVILNENSHGQQFMMAATTEAMDLMLVYTPVGKKIKVDLTVLNPENLKAYWYNPRSGKAKLAGEFTNTEKPELTPWSQGEGSDFILIVLGENDRYSKYISWID